MAAPGPVPKAHAVAKQGDQYDAGTLSAYTVIPLAGAAWDTVSGTMIEFDSFPPIAVITRG
jgi:hypothetical protein